MEVNLNIEKEDVGFLKKYLEGKTVPVELEEIAYQVALFKTREKRSNKVIVYSPNCEYKAEDLIYKEYPGKIPVGSKKYIEIEEGVVLRVAETKERFGFFEIKLCYEGTSDFKKYTDYLDRQKIELLLPHKQEKPYAEPEYLAEDIDPRLQQAPLLERDFNILKRKLVSALNKEADLALVSRKALRQKYIKPIDAEVFDKIRNFLTENKKSTATEFLVENFAGIDPGSEDFSSYCFALNYTMKTGYKIDFQQTNDTGWGKWNLISVIYYMKKDSIMSETNPLLDRVVLGDKKNIGQKRRKFEEALFIEGPTRYYLTQREVTAGAINTKPGFFDLGESIEIEIIDGKTRKPYLFYYYSDVDLMIGFKEIYEKYKVLQGAVLNFEQSADGKLYFNIRTTKKGTIADVIEYVPGKNAFRAIEEKAASPVFAFKSMFLESTVFNTIYEHIDEFRNIETFNKLVHKVFLEFGVKEKNYEIHILRLHHILDLIFPTGLKLVEDILLSNPEFVPSEKLSGVFYLDSEVVAEIEEAEYRRKELAVDETKKKREESRKQKRTEEQKVRDEIKKKREERRKKREDEMFLKEKLEKEKKEREEKRLEELRKKKEALKRKSKAPKFKPRESELRKRFYKEGQSGTGAVEKEAALKQDFPKPRAETPVKESPGRPAHSRKAKKKAAEENAPKTPKKIAKKPLDESMSEDEIKSQIKLEELKQTVADRKERPSQAKKEKKDKKIAYSDDGGFGGAFASKLDEIVKKEDSKEDSKEEDKEKKSTKK
ncbi:MAG: hypothetical protein KAW12_17770 [Candidatus Aminicenantes bacterium]|nr:hypothetical protein [Candidatus Aminicenantes bacterium]